MIARRRPPIRIRCAALALAACVANARAAGEGPAELARFPELQAMHAVLTSGSALAHNCATAGGLFVEANELIRRTPSTGAVAQALVSRHRGEINAAERVSFERQVRGIAEMASVLLPLAEDSATVAFSRLCLNRANGADAGPQDVEKRFGAASACEARHPAGSLERKDCIAGAFRAR